MVLPGTDRADLRQIRTHPHTIEQCSKFINGLVDVDVVPTTDTAGAASYVKGAASPLLCINADGIAAENGMKAFGAIASRQAADLYGLSYDFLSHTLPLNRLFSSLQHHRVGPRGRSAVLDAVLSRLCRRRPGPAVPPPPDAHVHVRDAGQHARRAFQGHQLLCPAVRLFKWSLLC